MGRHVCSTGGRMSFGGGLRDDPAVRGHDHGPALEGQFVFLADPVAQGDEVAVLKGRCPELRLVEPFRPFAHGSGLRDENQAFI